MLVSPLSIYSIDCSSLNRGGPALRLSGVIKNPKPRGPHAEACRNDHTPNATERSLLGTCSRVLVDLVITKLEYFKVIRNVGIPSESLADFGLQSAQARVLSVHQECPFRGSAKSREPTHKIPLIAVGGEP